MKRSSFVLAALAMIAIIADFRVDGLPSPQADGGRYKHVDGFAFDEGGDGEIPLDSSTGGRPQLVQTTPPVVLQPLGVTIVPTTEASELVICIQNCQFQVTSEYNPVCGTDRTDYSNAGKLLCARNCGRDVNLVRVGKCNTSIRR